MTYLAAAALALAALELVLFGGLLRWQARQHVRERQADAQERTRLIDQVCHLSGKPWTPAPAELIEPPEETPREEALIGDIEQYPDLLP